jgi:Na+/proline symporter
MKIETVYLLAFLAYSLFILGVGLWGYRKTSLASFAVAERKMGLVVSTGTFMATFVSAVTVIGVSGYASRYGWSAAAFSCYGYALGWILLVLAAGRLHRTKLTTVPEFLYKRYRSTALRVFAAGTIILMYSLVLMVQLLAMGVTLNTLAGINTSLAIVIVGAVFVSYTMLGGLAAVIRTDLVQVVLLGGGVVLAACIVIARTSGAVLFSPPEHLGHFFGGNVQSVGDFAGWMLVWGLGIPTESYYLHRFYASRSASVARLQVGIGGMLVMVILISVIICGVGAGMLNPPNHHDNSAFPYLFKNVVGGWASVIVLFAIMSAVQSSSSGLLHIVGLYFAVDIYKQFGNREGRNLLKVSRLSTLVFGTVITLATVYVATHSSTLISLIAGISWGGMASAMFVPLFSGLFWKRATRAGALASSIGGLVCAVIGFSLKQAGVISVHEIYAGLIGSAVFMLAGSALTSPEPSPFVESLFASRKIETAA